MSASSRQIILDSIQAGTRSTADAQQRAADYAALPRPYAHAGMLDSASAIALLIHRLREYGAEVVECAPDEIAATIAARIAAENAASGRQHFVAPPGLPAEWLTPDAKIDWKVDHGLSAEEIDRTDGVLTAAFCAIADSGTIVLHHSSTETRSKDNGGTDSRSTDGRRILTLLPDWHLCVLRASQLIETLPEYFARCPDPPPLATWISGPSATADIEMTRIKGVHGPRFLHVILVRDEAR